MGKKTDVNQGGYGRKNAIPSRPQPLYWRIVLAFQTYSHIDERLGFWCADSKKPAPCTTDWKGHLGASDSLLVNASTWALMLTGRVVKMDDGALGDVGSFLRRLVAKSGEPLIRQAMTQAMRILGRQFVMGRTIEEALERARGPSRRRIDELRPRPAPV